MVDPTIDETRDGARVVVYGDSAPVTEQEWHCARLVWELYDGAPLEIGVRPYGFRAAVTHAGSVVHRTLQPTRAEAVAGVEVVLASIARRDADYLERAARKLRHGGAWWTTDQFRARAARLRALLAGAP